MNLARAITVASVAASLLLCSDVGRAFTRGTIVGIEIHDGHPEPAKPTTPVDNIHGIRLAFWRCWKPPPLDGKREPLDLTFQVSFKRSGELFGKPRAIQFAREITPEERERYYQAVAAAVERCSQMPFTASMGGAVAGRTFRVTFIDARNRKQADVSWLITKTS
jgi:hypothetical protein